MPMVKWENGKAVNFTPEEEEAYPLEVAHMAAINALRAATTKEEQIAARGEVKATEAALDALTAKRLAANG